jgi:predicted  nucleic acid-binding Zn-ribbon protein
MSEITLQAIEQLLDAKLKPIKSVMASLATSEEITQINTKLEAVQTTQAKHTTDLANLATDVKKLLDEKTVINNRVERLEHWAKPVGEKIGVKLGL